MCVETVEYGSVLAARLRNVSLAYIYIYLYLLCFRDKLAVLRALASTVKQVGCQLTLCIC